MPQESFGTNGRRKEGARYQNEENGSRNGASFRNESEGEKTEIERLRTRCKSIF